MHQSVMETAEQDQVLELRLATVGPVRHVVGVREAEPAARESASAVPGLEGAPDCGRNRPCPAADVAHRVVGSFAVAHRVVGTFTVLHFTTRSFRNPDHTRVARKPPGRFRGNACPVFQLRTLRLALVLQRGGIYVEHHLIALGTRAAEGHDIGTGCGFGGAFARGCGRAFACGVGRALVRGVRCVVGRAFARDVVRAFAFRGGSAPFRAPEPRGQRPLSQEPHRIRAPLLRLDLLRGARSGRAGSEQGVTRSVDGSHEHRPHLRVQPATHQVHALLVREDGEAA